MERIAILIPTLRRPDSLSRALRSVFAQDLFLTTASRDNDAAPSFEIVVVDNAPEASARETVEALRHACPIELTYVHAPNPGVATARNAGLAATAADQIVFIDDDEEAPPHWLSALLAVHRAFGADVTFGPVRGVAAEARPDARPYLEDFFSRIGPDTSGPITEVFGCGNSVMRRSVALPGAAPFDVGADQVGGEDDRLFTVLKAQSARFAWAADAHVFEHAPAHRATVRYALKRALGYGQSPCQICLRAGDRLGVAKWMLIGSGQALVYGAVAAVLWAMRQPQRYTFADRAARGLGKLLWTTSFRFYGAAEARRTARTVSGGARLAGRVSLTASRVKITQSNPL